MPYRYRVCALLFALVVVMYLDRLCIAVAGPRMQHDLNIAPRQWGWVLGAFALSYALFEVPSGMLGDRIGPRKVLTRIVLWWSCFTAITGAVSSLGMLLVVRFLFGAGEAGAFPNSASVIKRWIPQQERARASSVFWVATSVGGVITPFIVVAMEQKYSWRVAFPLFAALGLVWAGVWYWWFRDSPWLKSEVPQQERELVEQTPASVRLPVDWGRLLHDGNFQRLLLMYHTYCWGAYFYLSWLYTYLQVGRGLSENEMRIASSLPAWAGIVGVVTGGFLSDYLAARYSLRVARCSIGAVSLIGAGIFLACATITPDRWWAVAFLTISLGVMNTMLPVAWSLCVDMGQHHAGTVSGAMNMAGQLGSLVSSVAFGYLVEWLGSYDKALMPMAAMLIVSGLLFASIKPTVLVAEAPMPGAPSLAAAADS